MDLSHAGSFWLCLQWFKSTWCMLLCCLVVFMRLLSTVLDRNAPVSARPIMLVMECASSLQTHANPPREIDLKSSHIRCTDQAEERRRWKASNYIMKANSVNVVPEWNPAAERLEWGKKAWESWGGAMLLESYVHKEDTSSCCDAAPAPLDSLCHVRNW